MKYWAVFLSVFASLLSAAIPASAQNDVGDIFGDIFKGGQYPTQQQATLIDNIPVQVRFDAGPQGLPSEAMLVVTAYAPPPANVRRASPLMLGETRLLLSGLTSPVSIVVAAPAQVTEGIDFARIESKIVDHNGTVIFELRNAGEFRGYEPAKIFLTPFGQIAGPAPAPYEQPAQSATEAINGTVNITNPSSVFRGANLVVRLMEDGLAGGISRHIVGETRTSLDGKSAPYNFALERILGAQNSRTPLAFEVWIEDWAGRKTHVMPRPVPFNGAATNYRFALDAITSTPPECTPENPCTNMPTLPAPIGVPAPGIPSARTITGEAQFDAYKGLPKGSILTAEIERFTSGRPEQLAKTLVSLDGKSGNINFTLDIQETALDARLPAPVLRVRIEDKDGKLFFSNPGGAPLSDGFNSVQLRAAPNY